MFLMPDQLYELTGYKQKNRQIKKLEQEGIPFIYSRYGHPKVPISYIQNLGNQGQPKRRREPNFEGFKQRLKPKAK